MSNNNDNTLMGGLVQSTDVKVQLTGKLVHVPSNFVTTCLYKYHCVGVTSLGDIVLGASISERMQNSMSWMEKYDFVMHYLGNFVFIALLTGVNRFSFFMRVLFAIPVILHHVILLVTIAFFAIPLNRAKNLALIAPTNNRSNIPGSALINDFVTITATESTTYALTDFQRAIVAQASVSGSITVMLYNKIWSAKYVHPGGRLNVFMHVIPFLIAVTSPRSITSLVLAYIIYIIIWYVICYCSKGSPGCFDFLFCPLYCLFACCTPSEKSILARVQDGSTKDAIKLSYIEVGSCPCVKYI